MRRNTVILISIAAALITAACRQTDSEFFWPSAEISPTVSVLMEVDPGQVEIESVIETVPDFSTWEVGEQVSEEQQIYINRLVEYAWYSYFSPYSHPDCAALRDVLSSENPWLEHVDLHCALMSEQGYFVMFPILPEWNASYYAFPDSPNAIRFVVRLDSGAPWTADVRYFRDGAQMGYMSYMRTIIDFHIAIEEDKLLIGLIDEFYLDEDGGVWDRGENGDLVQADLQR